MIMRKLLAAAQALLLFIAISPVALAQSEDFEELPLNGLAAYVKLRDEYYIGALYLESLSEENATFNFSGKKRMEILVTIDKWSQRRFANDWSQALLINNDPDLLNQFSEQILDFTDLPKDDLIAGDLITIDRDSKEGTIIYINGNDALTIADPQFFDLLLNVWIGQRPPSSDFKDAILTLPTDQAATSLLVRFESTKATDARTQQVAAWYEKAAAVAAAPAPTAADIEEDSRSLPPPEFDTAVTAKRIQEVETAAVAAVVEKVVTAPEPAPAPKPAPEPKAAPATLASEPVTEVPEIEAPQVAKVLPDQDLLLRRYRSNAIKLTYLNTSYPERAISSNYQGTIILRLKLNRSGEVVEIIEEETSNYRLLNNAALSAIKKTAPFPEVPEDLQGDEIEFTLPFNFKL